MQCSTCRFENPPEMKFCGGCGRRLDAACRECGASNPASFQYCGQCGRNLAEPEAREAPAIPSHTRDEALAERRQLTVMFCDMVGSTELSEKLDPEDWRLLLRTYQTACTEVIERFNGWVAQYLGDGLLVYFGYPQAHEDDSRSAVLAGLGIVDALEELSRRQERERGVGLSVRIGIHTGPVVTGEVGSGMSRERLAMGQTPNVAARFQAMAEPGWVVVGARTHELVASFFTFEALGSKAVKGLSDPVEAFRVLGESGTTSRFDAAISKGLLPLVGRRRELELLETAYANAAEGRGSTVAICGDAGLGKSRLVHQVREHLAERPHRWLSCYCSPYHLNSSLYPVIELLRKYFRFEDEDSAEKRLRKVESGLEPAGSPGGKAVPLFASLLSLEAGPAYEPLALAPQRLKHEILRAVIALFTRMAESKPVIVLVEDLHWADPSTLELLELLIAETRSSRIVSLLTFRPSFAPRWEKRPGFVRLDVEPLTGEETECMIRQLAGPKPLPPEVIGHIADKTDGVPFFVEELVRTVMSSGLVRKGEAGYELAAPLRSMAIPATLQDSLTARLDRLAEVKQTVGMAAVLGREFTRDMLEAVSALDRAILERQLALLVRENLIHPSGQGVRAKFVFRHALIQDAAYQLLLKAQRQQYHQRAAEILVERFMEVAETQPELVARHYQEAGCEEPAVRFWFAAGKRAVLRSADREAVGHLENGLELLARMPDTPENRQQELGFQITLGRALGALKGYAAPEIEKAYMRARELCRQIEESPQLFWVELGVWAFYANRGAYATALEVAERLLYLAGRHQDPIFFLEGHFTLGATHFLLGDPELARRHLIEGIAYDRDRRNRLPATQVRLDPRVIALCFLGMAEWQLGRQDEAVSRVREGLEFAREIADAFGETNALYYGANLHQLRGEPDESARLAAETIALCEEHRFPQYLSMARVIEAWATIRTSGDAESGLGEMRRGIDAHLDTGTRMQQTYLRALLAEAAIAAGRHDLAAAELGEGSKLMAQTGERFWEPEYLRLEGELALLATGSAAAEEAERRFQQARELAHERRARSLELRAATSLGRLWSGTGRTQEARDLLRGALAGFSRGSESADQKGAAELLRSLSS